MAGYDFKSESEVKDFINNLGIEYRFGCYSEKKPEVCHLLGDYLESIKKDYDKAGKVYKTNCDDYKYGKSCLKYGTYCLLGKGGIKEDFPVAYNYLETGCKNNEADACFNQGLLLVTDNEKRGINMDILKGMELLKKGCEGKNANACYYLSGMYISGVKTAKGKRTQATAKENGEFLSKPNMKLAHQYALEGCKLGNIFSCANVSQMYAKGDGVEKNEELAAKFKKITLEMQEEMESNKTLKFQEGLQ
ncbi:PREDICTED: cytochrome c oxidase assembly factor 7 homolog [Nicrophorus vespilloides]|uniref:Cytochrome c oxidase assembly factor 7 homolog n=1 Tax=Nicrophorus vespilloides TaxID=110193 RepID=A0ABM1N3K1_NICVS|nr:PREDICTED: cytochrome c oxidase assembly factor 7 homolog [Nicrophorus vespilloides]